jgi:hypothetical protein
MQDGYIIASSSKCDQKEKSIRKHSNIIAPIQRLIVPSI